MKNTKFVRLQLVERKTDAISTRDITLSISDISYFYKALPSDNIEQRSFHWSGGSGVKEEVIPELNGIDTVIIVLKHGRSIRVLGIYEDIHNSIIWIN